MTDPARPPEPIEAVIFDYGGVLTTAPFAHLGRIEEELGYAEGSVSRLLFGDGHHPNVTDPADGTVPDWHLLEIGELSLDAFHERLAERSVPVLGVPLDIPLFNRMLWESGLGVHWMVVARARELRAGGRRTAILTNNVAEWGPTWRASIPVAEFDVVVDSSAVGLRKPQPAIFTLTCERLGVAPGRAVFLDDTRRHVEVARACGLHAIHFSDPWDGLAELDALLGWTSAAPPPAARA